VFGKEKKEKEDVIMSKISKNQINIPMVKINEVTQLGYVVKNIEKAKDIWWKTLGVGPWRTTVFKLSKRKDAPFRGELHGKSADYSMKLAFANVGKVQIELIQPLEGPSIYKEHLTKKGEGFHHFACYSLDAVKNLPNTMRTFKEMGIDVLMSGVRNESAYYYMNTEPILGFIYECGGKINRDMRLKLDQILGTD